MDFITVERDEKSLGDEGTSVLFSIGSFWLWDESEGGSFWESPNILLVVSLHLLNEPVSGGEEEVKFWKNLWEYLQGSFEFSTWLLIWRLDL